MKWLTPILVMMLTLSGVMVDAQETLSVEPDAAFIAYQCTFDRDRSDVQIRASLVGGDGLPIPRDAYQVAVTAVESGETLDSSLVETEVVVERPPLQMILVLDTTDTMEIESVVNAIRDDLMPQLLVQDRVALVTFAENVSPRTQFFTDKNRLLNEHMIDLLPGQGDNRLYDAIFEAVTELPINDNTRQVVLAITDSNRRDIEQIDLSQIIERAQRETIQVYTVGINSREDEPDVAELEQLAEATGGYVWLVDEEFITREAIERLTGAALDDLIDALSSEILITVDVTGRDPNASGFIPFEVQVSTSNDATLIDTISCPVETLFHSIAFAPDVPQGTILGPVDVAVNFQSDLPAEETVVYFLLDGEVAAQTENGVFRFNDPPTQPGYYTLSAQLRSRSGEMLATTSRAIELYVQPQVALDIGGGYFGSLEGEVRFEVSAEDDSFELPPVEFTVAPQSNPDDAQPLTTSPIPFESGVAVLVIDDIQERVRTLFPDAETERFVVQARVPSLADDEPPVTSLFEVVVPRIELEPEVVLPRFSLDLQTLYWTGLIGLLVLNLLLFRAVGRSRVRYRINHPDNQEMSAQLMTITVRREGVKQAHTLTQKTVTIGRGSTNDIHLGDDPNISRSHGVVMWRNGYWYYSNRKRRALTRINGKRRVGFIWQKLVPITEIEIGNSLLIFHSNAQQDVSEFIKTNL
jgi:hypothetical protein